LPFYAPSARRRQGILEAARPPWSACQSGPARFGRDPWDSYDKAGNLYFIGQPIDSAALGFSAISVTTWNAATSNWRGVAIDRPSDRTTRTAPSCRDRPRRRGQLPARADGDHRRHAAQLAGADVVRDPLNAL
jgi:hypothetical protein